MIGHSISVEFFVMDHGFELVLISVDFCGHMAVSHSPFLTSIWGSLKFPVDLFRVTPNQS